MENTQVGPFQILSRLGSNRRQRVYRAVQKEQGREVALKFISFPPDIPWPTVLEKIEREVEQLQKLRHPNLVRMYGAGVEDDRIFFATELVEGESLSSILSRRGRLAPDLVVEYGRQIAEFLVFLHDQSLVHSKLTPDKVLITENHQVKISDLRLNRSKRRRWDATRRRELDLAAYMAPEQFTEGATQKSDFYALGVMLYEMLCGKLPYPPDTMGRMTHNKMNAPVPSVATQVMNCPIWLDKLITQLLDPNPKRRPHSAQAIAMAFEEIRQIDATQQPAVAQMTSGFTPLTAGQDKSEAQRLLQREQANAKPDQPWLNRVWVQVTALILISIVIVYLVWPASPKTILAEAQALVQSDDPDQWSRARILLEPLRNQDSAWAEKADQLYYQSRRKSLVARAESGKINRLDSQEFQQFSKAVRLQQEGENEDAADLFASLMASVDPQGQQRHIYVESEERYRKLTEQVQWPRDETALLEMIEEARAADGEAALIGAQARLGQLTIQFAGEPGFETVTEKAESVLQEIKQRLLEIQTSEAAQTVH